jgi:regulator of sirC expression with transglutaminase-like and TPR domain
MSEAEEARAALDAAGQLPDGELDLAAVALQFARIDAPEADWRAAAGELSLIARRAVEAAAADPAADRGDATRRASVLAALMHGELGFLGDAETYEDTANANLIQVLVRRRGLPVALGILWLHAARRPAGARMASISPATSSWRWKARAARWWWTSSPAAPPSRRPSCAP